MRDRAREFTSLENRPRIYMRDERASEYQRTLVILVMLQSQINFLLVSYILERATRARESRHKLSCVHTRPLYTT